VFFCALPFLVNKRFILLVSNDVNASSAADAYVSTVWHQRLLV